jgi:hypothetical protein
MRGSEHEIPNSLIKKNAIPTSRNLNEEFLDPEFPSLKWPDPGVLENSAIYKNHPLRPQTKCSQSMGLSS